MIFNGSIGTILRVQHTENFTQITNALLQDADVTAEELGVLCYLLSRPDDWVSNTKNLCKRFSCGQRKILSILSRLDDKGYLDRHKRRDGEGRFFWHMMVSEEPTLK